jgi:hypothetical protein
MIDVYVRHSADCPKGDDSSYKRCRCPKWLYVDIPGKGPRSRTSAKTRSWEKAEQEARRIESGASLPEARNEHTRITIAAAVDEYLQAAGDRGIESDTKLKKIRTLKETAYEKATDKKGHRKVSPSPLCWSKSRGLVHLEQLGTRELTQ